jgi:hypothetical protein
MMNDLETLLEQIKNTPEKTEFNDVISIIDKHYRYIPTRFKNGADNDVVINTAGENEGSCKIFSFARINNLNKEQTLNCFGQYYRDDVLSNPDQTDHANIRTFIRYGWEHVTFEGDALKEIKE